MTKEAAAETFKYTLEMFAKEVGEDTGPNLRAKMRNREIEKLDGHSRYGWNTKAEFEAAIKKFKDAAPAPAAPKADKPKAEKASTAKPKAGDAPKATIKKKA